MSKPDKQAKRPRVQAACIVPSQLTAVVAAAMAALTERAVLTEASCGNNGSEGAKPNMDCSTCEHLREPSAPMTPAACTCHHSVSISAIATSCCPSSVSVTHTDTDTLVSASSTSKAPELSRHDREQNGSAMHTHTHNASAGLMPTPADEGARERQCDLAPTPCPSRDGPDKLRLSAKRARACEKLWGEATPAEQNTKQRSTSRQREREREKGLNRRSHPCGTRSHHRTKSQIAPAADTKPSAYIEPAGARVTSAYNGKPIVVKASVASLHRVSRVGRLLLVVLLRVSSSEVEAAHGDADGPSTSS